ncbi:MAG: hypothetical protein ACR2MD_11710, partial [Aridibacter sp.]
MNILKITLIIALTSVIFGCTNSAIENTKAKDSATEQDMGIYTAELSISPDSIVSGQPVELKFLVKDPKGETFTDLEITHEKPIHLYVVSEDLSQFYHQHPTKNADSIFEDTFTFPNGGKYKIFVDYKPKNSKKLFDSYSLAVSGDARKNVEIIPDQKFEKTVEGLRITMNADGDLVSNKELMLTFQVFDAAANKPATDLQNYLGAKVHFVIISKDLKDFVHVHAMSKDNVKSEEHSHGDNHTEMHTDEKLAGINAESYVSAMVTFPKAGIYKIFATFKHKDKLTIVPFIFEVKKGNEEKPIDLSNAKFPAGAYKIIVSKNGFTPQTISYKANNPLKLAFYRADQENCVDGIVFKDLNIKK